MLAVEHFFGVQYDALESDDHVQINWGLSDDNIFESNLPHNHVHHSGVLENLGDHNPSQLDGTVQGFEFIHELQLNSCISVPQGWGFINSVPEDIIPSRSNLSLEQREPISGQENHFQQLVSSQKKQLEDFAMRCVELQHQLWESEMQRAGLQQECEQLRFMLQEAANAHASTWSAGFIIDFQQEGRDIISQMDFQEEEGR
ncbi:hypothetical protein M758_9G173800 [Ceratodon purpureus]|nr:hypothetical protein M758_9G173800 [Ceratodon purpureus]